MSRLQNRFHSHTPSRNTILSWILLFVVTAASGFGQSDSAARSVYALGKDSVFLVYLDDANGAPTALGSAFVVASHLLVTNAHVVQAGNPVLAVGPVRVPLKVLRIDRKHDLATLSVEINLVSKPLLLSSTAPSPGDQVFAIGNPEGLENTISQGIVSGLRTIDDQDLIQVTSPISHGSSGGPILNGKGEVVGVAVGMLENGQNLNFAVPVKYVRTLIEVKPDLVSRKADCSTEISRTREILDNRNQDQYSSDESSQYQQDTRDFLQHAAAASEECGEADALEQLACLGTKDVDLSDIGIAAARKLVDIKPSADSRSLLAYALYDRSENESFASQLSKDGSPEKANAEKSRGEFITQAAEVANQVEKQATANSFLVASYVLGVFKKDKNDISGAMNLYALAATATPKVCGVDLSLAAYRSLTTDAPEPALAETWFKKYSSKYQPEPYEWDAEGDRRNATHDNDGAADAYERAATSNNYTYDYCFAALNRYDPTHQESDALLTDGRKCIDGSVQEGRRFAKKFYDQALPAVYEDMAEILEKRGVFSQALEYVKSSLALQPNDAFALYTEALIFEDTQRVSECISAAEAAIRNSDGKYPWMHFLLGNCYFDAENWGQAAISFRISADRDKTDASSAFNLGLSLKRQGFSADAHEWFQEALRRNPPAELRGKVENALR